MLSLWNTSVKKIMNLNLVISVCMTCVSLSELHNSWHSSSMFLLEYEGGSKNDEELFRLSKAVALARVSLRLQSTWCRVRINPTLSFSWKCSSKQKHACNLWSACVFWLEFTQQQCKEKSSTKSLRHQQLPHTHSYRPGPWGHFLYRM